MKKHISSRVLSLVLTLALVLGMAVPAVSATGSETVTPVTSESLNFEKVDDGVSAPKTNEIKGEEVEKMEYGPNDVVRVSIVMDKPATLSAGFSSESIATNAAAISYRDSLKANQNAVAQRIADKTGETLDVVWNLTLAANLISANVKFSQIEEIEAVAGVKEVVIENRYEPQTAETSDEPQMATSTAMTGANIVWANGYTGAGTKVAVIDTGIDPDHQSFSEGGYNYAMEELAKAAGMSLEDYKASVGVMTQANVEKVADQLNAKVDPAKTYLSDKVPYAYNYVDENYVIDHDHDDEGEHGSHVEGIAAANRYISDGEGGYVPALDSVMTQGVAPDAQIVTMKVFGAGGGAYDSDYMAAIEDAIVLGCDSCNLSLGSGNPGFAFSGTYQAVMDSLEDCSTVVTISAGNSGGWNDTPNSDKMPPYIYAEDISLATNGSPGSYTNSLGVASVDNAGVTGMPLKFGDNLVFYTESTGYTNPSIVATIPGENSFVLFDNTGVDAAGNNLLMDYADVLAGKVAMVYRGASSFYQKMDAAAAAGAIGCIVINNQPGTINMDLSSATSTIPCISITQADGEAVKAMATPVTPEGSESVAYYTGSFTVTDKVTASVIDSDYYTMSEFSSWGVPGSLTLKPEITAPGGNIYSVNGLVEGGKDYELMSGTSMAAPQVAGMAALVGQYVRENDLTTKTGLTARQLTTSLLMSTAEPMLEDYGDYGDGYYPVLRQGAGLANVGAAVAAKSYILMDEDSTASAHDGKVKAELGDDAAREGVYDWAFSINNFSDEDLSYQLYTDLFTQDLTSDGTLNYMDTWTRDLGYTQSYTVDGVEVQGDFTVYADVNMDGTCDNKDVQAILDYVAGNDVTIDTDAADVDGNGEITSYDAYLLLTSYKAQWITVPAGKSVEVQVHVELLDECKAFLNQNYTSGAYIEGYTYVYAATNEEGAFTDSVHSIPVLGFYGSWTDASMFDNTSVVDVAYNNVTKIPYTGKSVTNGLYVRYANDSSNYWFLGNPYVEEDSFPVDRLAVSSNTNLYQFRYNLIRNAAAVGGAVTDENGKVLWTGTISSNVNGAFYYSNGGSWQNTNTSSYTVNKTLGSMGAKEGQKVTFGVYAIPEYYANPENGKLTSQEFASVIESGVLGHGASISYTAVVDDTAPEVLSISKDLTSGNLTVTAQDDNYIAAVMVANSTGTKIYGSALPEQTQAGQAASAEIDLSQVDVGTKALVLVADYAGNETVYQVEYASEPASYDGNFYGFTSTSGLETGARWVQLTADNLWFDNASSTASGIETVSSAPVEITAAEYVNGYVFMAAQGQFLVAPQGAWDEVQKVAKTDLDVVDMAYNYADETLYVLDDANNIYSMDTQTGATTAVASVTLTNPATSLSRYLAVNAMTIDDEGNFYFVNYGSADKLFLYKMALSDVAEGKVTLDPVVNDKTGNLSANTRVYNIVGSLAWNHDTDKLYLAGNYTVGATPYNCLYVIDTQTGAAALATASAPEDFPSAYVSCMVDTTVALYIVPSTSSVPPVTAPTGIELNTAELSLLKGSTATLSADVYPWNLQDKSVTWESSAPEIASVEDGKVTGLAEGTAIITATTVAQPAVSATCTVTVKEAPVAKMSGLIYNVDGEAGWYDISSDAPQNATFVAAGNTYVGGGISGETIYTIGDDNMYAIDADTFEATSLGTIASSWQYADAAEIPEAYQETFGGKLLAPCNGGTYLEALNPEKGSLSYWNDVDDSFEADPMAAIAFVGETTYEDEPALVYLCITENGNLWAFVAYGEGYLDVEKIGSTGLELGNVSAVTGGVYASMVYDQESGFLFLASYVEGENAQMYAIDPDTCQYALTGTFGTGVWPAVALYQYNRITELTVKLSDTQRSLFVGGSLTLTATVKPISYTGGVTWSSDNEEVATVVDGVVTAVGPGTAHITATSVDVNESGEHVSASCEVTVREKVSVDATVNAQIVSGENGTYYAIDLKDLSTTEIAKGAMAYDAGGMALGNLYGMYGNYFVLDADGSGYDFTAYPNYIAVDMANFPAYGENNGCVIYPSTTNRLVMFEAEAGSISAFNLSSTGMNLCAMAYAGSFEDEDVGTVLAYAALGTDGKLYLLNVYGDGDEMSLARDVLADLGMSFDANATSISYYYAENEDDTYTEGVIIADAATMTLYWVDLSVDEPQAAALGNLEGDYISSLYGDMDKETTTASNQSLSVLGHGTMKAAIASLSEKDLVAQTESLTPANRVVGSTNAVSGTAMTRQTLKSGNAAAADGTATVNLTETEDVTNGVFTVSYDPEVLTFVGATGTAGFYSYNDDGKGTITVAYAAEEAITAGSTIASLTFSYKNSFVDTKVEVLTKERNQVSKVEEDAAVIAIRQEDGGHDYQVTDSKAATCTEDGFVTYTCSKCGDSYTETVKALGHDFEETKTEVTCTEAGYTTVKCKNCDASYIINVIQPTGHSYELVNAKAATCTEEGYTGDRVCSKCNDTVKGTVIAATGHKWGEWVTVKEATATEDGQMQRTCSVCHEVETQVIPATGTSDCPSAAFNDVVLDIWYHEAVDFVVENGLMNGTSATTFSPEDTMTRAMLVTVLWRYEGSPKAEASDFTDVAADAYYAQAVAWAAENGVVNGVGEGRFDPNGSITREQLATILYRYAEKKGLDVTKTTDMDIFPDEGSVSTYAVKAMSWAVAEGLITGMKEGSVHYLAPQGDATRAQVATILMRFIQNIAK